MGPEHCSEGRRTPPQKGTKKEQPLETHGGKRKRGSSFRKKEEGKMARGTEDVGKDDPIKFGGEKGNGRSLTNKK